LTIKAAAVGMDAVAMIVMNKRMDRFTVTPSFLAPTPIVRAARPTPGTSTRLVAGGGRRWNLNTGEPERGVDDELKGFALSQCVPDAITIKPICDLRSHEYVDALASRAGRILREIVLIPALALGLTLLNGFHGGPPHGAA